MRHSVLGMLSLVAALAATTARAQSFGKMSSSSSSSSYRTFAATMPLISTREPVAHLEFNLFGEATLSLEASMLRAGDDMDEEQMKEKQESLASRGRAAALLFSRYSDSDAMAGFFWTLGAGYREMDVRWSTKPDVKDPQVDFALVDPKSERLHHDATLKGMTGHLRFGYRYVPEALPVSIGGFIGFRHFQAGVDDAERADGEREDWQEDAAYARMTDREKERLRKRYTTRFEPGLEVGFVF